MIPRMEHPKPQFERAAWRNLNGEWDFEIDHGNSGEARGLYKEDSVLNGKITVPFCPESKLSGVGYTDFMYSVWYKRTFELSQEELSGRVVLHFGAVDYEASVYINGEKCGSHKGGYTSFSFDITSFVRKGENVITLHAEDDTRSRMIPSGKQSHRYYSKGCYYTRTTGIWQTVWLEFTPLTYIEKAKYYPDSESASLTVIATLVGKGEFKLSASFADRCVGSASVYSGGGTVTLNLPLSEKHLWQVGEGNLYNLELSFGEDKVKSYFGLRKIRIDGRRVLINEKCVFQRLVLDQGFYPDGIYTAPSDEELRLDIERSLAMGFNGARLHEKIFEERFLYYADKLGYIVWEEYPNLGLNPSYLDSIYPMLPEWCEAIERDFNHPSIVGWAPFNETFSFGYKPDAELIKLAYTVTKQLDSTRPVIDASGGIHTGKTDIMDTHNYEQDEKRFAWLFEKMASEDSYYEDVECRDIKIGSLPFFVSEYGGASFRGDGKELTWGYGTVKTAEEFIERARTLTDIIVKNPLISGFCYTQLTDVEQEQNGLYTYSRVPKVAPEKLNPIFSAKAAIEEE